MATNLNSTELGRSAQFRRPQRAYPRLTYTAGKIGANDKGDVTLLNFNVLTPRAIRAHAGLMIGKVQVKYGDPGAGPNKRAAFPGMVTVPVLAEVTGEIRGFPQCRRMGPRSLRT